MLEQERAYYDEHLDEWLTRYPGRFVVVKGDRLVGTYDTVDHAPAEGASRFGLDSFLVRRVQPTQDPISIPAITLGLIGANPPRPVSG